MFRCGLESGFEVSGVFVGQGILLVPYVVRDAITKSYANSIMASLQWRSHPAVNLLLAIDGGHTLSVQVGDCATTLSVMILNSNVA